MFFATDPTPEDLDFAGKGFDFTNIDFVKAQGLLARFSNSIIETFTQGRARVYELQKAITDSVPGVTRLGGNIKDVSDTISGVALASRRSVVASTEDIEKLFAATKVLGGTAQEIAETFLNIGIGIEKIPETLEESISYVQSIGGNAKQIMKDVSENMGQMNRFQFEDGVRGLTKMAAQASMLRFSMKTTFDLAENVLDPEGAVKTASAFQRLGLAVGGLGDPLQLMNQALNDPSGLQDSLVEVAKKFAYFDKQTESFKINPEGVLTLRALQKDTQISAAEMSKLGLAAMELDSRLKAVNDVGLTIVREEDKQYLSNITNMEGGVFKVTLADGTKKELADLQQTEFDALLKAQKDQPKDLEGLARATLTTDKLIEQDVKAIRNVIAGGVLTAKPIQNLNEDIREVTDRLLGTISDKFETETVRKGVTNILGDMKSVVAELIKGGKFDEKTVSDKLIGDNMVEIAKFGSEAVKGVTDITKNLAADLYKKYTETDLSTSSIPPTTSTSTTSTAGTSRMTTTGISAYGTQTAASSPIFTQPTVPRNTSVNVGGEVNVNVKIPNLPVGFTQAEIEQAKQMIAEALSTPFFIKHIKTIMNEDPDYGPSRK